MTASFAASTAPSFIISPALSFAASRAPSASSGLAASGEVISYDAVLLSIQIHVSIAVVVVAEMRFYYVKKPEFLMYSLAATTIIQQGFRLFSFLGYL